MLTVFHANTTRLTWAWDAIGYWDKGLGSNYSTRHSALVLGGGLRTIDVQGVSWRTCTNKHFRGVGAGFATTMYLCTYLSSKHIKTEPEPCADTLLSFTGSKHDTNQEKEMMHVDIYIPSLHCPSTPPN